MTPPKEASHRIGGRLLPLFIRRRPGAVRMTLRLDTRAEALHLTLPKGISTAEGLAFLNSREGWIEAKLETLPPRVPFQDGAVVPILGRDHVIRHRPHDRRGTWVEEGVIHVSGHPEHLPRRLQDWLKERAKAEIAKRVHAKAQAVRRPVRRVFIRDPKARWGSCTQAGHLAFSWRLVLAPVAVLDYVIAHEVAHLVELNHGVRFWRLVHQLAPGAAQARAWLVRHGNSLHRYGSV